MASTAAIGKNIHGGNKHKKGKTRRIVASRNVPAIDVEAGDGYFGIVETLRGTGSVQVTLHDGSKTEAMIPGRMNAKGHKTWIKKGQIVIVTADKLELLKVVQEGDPEMRTAKMLLKSKDEDDLFDDSGPAVPPSKQTLKSRAIKRNAARDEEHFTDEKILQQQSESFKSSKEVEPDEGERVDDFGNVIEKEKDKSKSNNSAQSDNKSDDKKSSESESGSSDESEEADKFDPSTNKGKKINKKAQQKLLAKQKKLGLLPPQKEVPQQIVPKSLDEIDDDDIDNL